VFRFYLFWKTEQWCATGMWNLNANGDLNWRAGLSALDDFPVVTVQKIVVLYER
jgi:hypothetical protein